MKNFLRAEWKTLLIVALAALGVYVVFQREDVSETRPGAQTAAEANVLPGERLGELSIHREPDELIAELGQPTRREPVEPGLEALHFAPRGVTLYLRDGGRTLAGIARDVARDDTTLIAPDGRPLIEDWDEANASLGPVLVQQSLEAERGLMRYDGLLVELDASSGESRPVRITLLPALPDDLRASPHPGR